MMGEANWTDIRNILKAGTMVPGLPFYAGVTIFEAIQQDDPLDVVRGTAFGVPYKDRPDPFDDEASGF